MLTGQNSKQTQARSPNGCRTKENTKNKQTKSIARVWIQVCNGALATNTPVPLVRSDRLGEGGGQGRTEHKQNANERFKRRKARRNQVVDRLPPKVC